VPVGPVDASAYASGLAAVAVGLAFIVVLRSFGTAPPAPPAARPLRQPVLPGGAGQNFRAELNTIWYSRRRSDIHPGHPNALAAAQRRFQLEHRYGVALEGDGPRGPPDGRGAAGRHRAH
jgi:hypothetical protein